MTVPQRNAINKIVNSAAEALKDLKSNSTLLCGVFGPCGVPETLIEQVSRVPFVTSLTAVSNNAGTGNSGLVKLLKTKQIRELIASYIGEKKVLEQMYFTGEIKLKLIPQGTLAECCSAGGRGIPAFYTPAAVGTVVQSGELPVTYNIDGSPRQFGVAKDTRTFNSRTFLSEESIKGDYALVKI